MLLIKDMDIYNFVLFYLQVEHLQNDTVLIRILTWMFLQERVYQNKRCQCDNQLGSRVYWRSCQRGWKYTSLQTYPIQNIKTTQCLFLSSFPFPCDFPSSFLCSIHATSLETFATSTMTLSVVLLTFTFLLSSG